MAPRRSTRSTRAADAKDKEKQSEEVVVQPEADAVPEVAPQVEKADEGERVAPPPIIDDKIVAEVVIPPAVTSQEAGPRDLPEEKLEAKLEEKAEAKSEGMIESKTEEPVKSPIEAKPEGIVKSKVEEPVKSPRHKESERARPEKESSRRKEEKEHESEKKDAKPKDSGRGREGGEERKDRSGREGDRKEVVEKKEQGRGDEKKREERDKVDRSKSDRPRESERRKDDERRKEEDRGKRSEKDGEVKRDDEKKRQEDRRKEDERRRESERHRRDGDRHKDDRSRREDDRSKKEDDKSKREDDRSRKDEGKPGRDEDKGRRNADRSKRDDPPKRDREGERKRDAEKESAPMPLPPPPPLPPNAEVEKVNLEALKEGVESARAKDPPAEEKGRKEERVAKDGDRRGDDKREDLTRGRSDKDRASRRSPPRESDRHRDRGRSDRDRERDRERERERERDRGRRPPSPPRRKHRSRSRSLSPRDARRRSSPRRRSPPGSRPVNKRAGYYSSGLGGYSPRRRKNGDRDSPSLSPDRKRSKGAGGAWDQPPPGMDATAVALWQQQMAMAQQMAAAAGANPFIQMGASSSLPNLNPLLTGMGSVQSPAVTRSQRRLYLGNLPPTVSDGEVLEFLNAAIISGGQQHVPGTRPVAAVQLTLDKGFGFADFTHPEDATIGTLLDGIVLHGNALKIRRPRDYVPPPTELLAATAGAMPAAVGAVGLAGQPAMAAPGTVTTASSIPLAAIPQSIVPGYISTDVPDGPNKIFLGNIHPSITVEKLREILTAFGQLKHYVMKYNKNVKPFKVYAFLEYMDSAVTPQAIAGLSGLMLARKPLVTAYATPTVQLGGAEGKEPTYAVPELAKPLLEEPSKVLEFANILTREELLTLTEEAVEELVEDITLECARFGTVKSSHVPKPVRAAKKEEADDTKDAIVKMEGDGEAKPVALQNGAAVTVKTEPMDEDEKTEDEKKEDEKKEEDKNEDGKMEEDGKAEEDGKVEEDVEEDDDKKRVVLLGDAGVGAKKEEEFISVEDPEGVGKIFVEFSREESAVKAAHALHNRVFNGKRVAVGYLPVKLYQKLYGKGFGLSHKSYDERQELSIKVQDFLYGPV